MSNWRHKLLRKKLPKSWYKTQWGERTEEVLEEFEAKMAETVNSDHDGLRKNESQWPIHRLHYEKNRFFYEARYKKEKDKQMPKEIYEFLMRNKILDASLIAKWKKPGYEFLCATSSIV